MEARIPDICDFESHVFLIPLDLATLIIEPCSRVCVDELT
jgi:hypothetical protein